jgi:bifunctional polynucleotide phosphatase/kinase
MWKEVDSVIYYIPTDFKFSPSLAIFNFDKTLVVIKNKYDKMKLTYWNENVKPKLKEITDKGASIMLYQCFFNNDLDHIKDLFDQLIKDLEIPIVAFFSTIPNKYSKPFTNMWKLIELFYLKQQKTINKATSIFVGNKAGRLSISSKKALDYSCIDRAFASNVGITFFTPERFFLKSTTPNIWQFSKLIISQENRKKYVDNIQQSTTPVIIDEINSLPKSNNYTIIVTGTPSCGKTTLAKKIKRKWDVDYKIGDVVHISENSHDTLDTFYEFIQTQLSEKKTSVIIDMNCFISNITKIVKISMINQMPILILEIKTNQEIAKLLDFIKIQKSSNYKDQIHNIHFWRTYYKQYNEPIYKKIPCVKYISFPLIIQICEELWYEYSY